MKNEKVPFALLSCFLIAFVLQGILKLCGIFVFEKALDWDIFNIIDSNNIINIIYSSILMFITICCLSFTFTTRFYSTKWYHYIIIEVVSLVTIILRIYNTNISFSNNTLLDILIYIVVPIIINFTTNKRNRLFKLNGTGIIVTISLHIMLYFVYLGLTYWSGILSSFIIIRPEYYLSAIAFLLRLEVYLGLILFMLSSNFLINFIKGGGGMILPFDIANDEAKEKELEEQKAKK